MCSGCASGSRKPPFQSCRRPSSLPQHPGCLPLPHPQTCAANAPNGCTEELYFAGRRLQSTDRLGFKANAKLLPSGEEITSPTTDNTGQKFATYFRDAGGLDYADQRYYTAVMVRFMTADPYIASAGVSEPSSWNRYGYVGGDPINRVDPRGLDWWDPSTNTLHGDPDPPADSGRLGTGSRDPDFSWQGLGHERSYAEFVASTKLLTQYVSDKAMAKE